MELIYFSNRPSEEGPLTLDTVPVEILHHICTVFCDHCDPMPKPRVKGFETHNPNKGKKDLLSLCLTSRAVRTVAQPVLFHHFSFGRHLDYDGPVAFQLIAAPFLQALSGKPQLRGAVKQLMINTKKYSSTVPGFVSRSKVNQDMAALLPRLGAKVGIQFHDFELKPGNLQEAMIQVMIAVCPNLSKLEIRIQRYWAFDKLAERAPTQSNTNQLRLSSLRTLDARVERFSTDNCTFPHEFCAMPAFKSLSERALVVASASRLETLKCTLATLEKAPEMPRLEVLTLDVRGPCSDLKLLFAKIPNLRELIYYSSNKHGPLPIEINAALRDHRDKLEVLAIHFWRVWLDEIVQMDPVIDNTEFRLGLLNDFTNLKVLIVDALRIRDEDKNKSLEEPFQTISDTIPESLELLCVHDLDEISYPDFRPLFEVADRFREGRFKALKHVLWTREESASYPDGLGYLEPGHDSIQSGAYRVGPVRPEDVVALKKRYPVIARMLHSCNPN
ncbi:unnamed protein product [Clonostachys rosea]|uniref:F-box domain-containing protein n=1 Tax=Bionectria ochroleuca TaxID=29856 RepID=A0ABY6UJU1_BIOOC|nr:unnamed protein product [Clonostachys rosea]